MTINSGMVYIQGPDGFTPLASVSEFTETATPTDGATENNIAAMNRVKPYTVTVTLRPHVRRRALQAMLAWRASGPLRFRQIIRAWRLWKPRRGRRHHKNEHD